jgi:hypothetical protein
MRLVCTNKNGESERHGSCPTTFSKARFSFGKNQCFRSLKRRNHSNHQCYNQRKYSLSTNERRFNPSSSGLSASGGGSRSARRGGGRFRFRGSFCGSGRRGSTARRCQTDFRRRGGADGRVGVDRSVVVHKSEQRSKIISVGTDIGDVCSGPDDDLDGVVVIGEESRRDVPLKGAGIGDVVCDCANDKDVARWTLSEDETYVFAWGGDIPLQKMLGDNMRGIR